jgi:2-polyprenyl-3-methyl-5-hydroxy-6-metoxy-1,4-benzoquinol methylase
MALHRELSKPFRRLTSWISDSRDRRRAQCLASEVVGYEQYLVHQLERTLLKLRSDTPFRGDRLIEQLVQHAGDLAGSAVLCVGCRSEAEIRSFYRQGAREVVGIDLVSRSPDILVMDMHRMALADRSFDVVFSCHSLEHAWDPAGVAREMARVVKHQGLVAIEVPIGFRTNESDRHDLGSAEAVTALFGSLVACQLWSEHQPAYSPANRHGTAVARVILRIR